MALALSGGVNVYGDFPADSPIYFCEGLAFFLLGAGWTMSATVPSFVSAGVPTQPPNNTTFRIHSIVYTFKTSITNTVKYEIKIGATSTDTFNNLVAAVVLGAGSGTLYSSATPVHPSSIASITSGILTISFKQGGPYGNGVPTGIGDMAGGGFKLLGKSYQARADATGYLDVIAFISVNGSSASVQAISPRDPTRFSASNKLLKCTSSMRYRVVANRCQFFTFVHGTDWDSAGSMAAVGVPYMAPAVAVGGVVPTAPCSECWYIFSDFGGTATPRTTLAGQTRITQTGHDDTDFSPANQVMGPGTFNDGCFETTVHTAAQVSVVTVASNFRWDLITNVGTLLNSPQWVGDVFMKLEPFVAWADVSLGDRQLKGQLYDAWLLTKQAAMEDVMTLADMGFDELSAIEGSSRNSGGSGYAPGDTGTIPGGEAIYVVDTVVSGAVATYHLTTTAGSYALALNAATVATTGGGSGFTIDITSVTQLSWLAFTDLCKWGTLWLLVPPVQKFEEVSGNYVY